MPIDKLNSTAGIIATLRAELNNRVDQAGRRSSRKSAPEARAAGTHDVQELRRQLTDLIKPVELDDPSAVRAIRPKVVRTILLWQFGPSLREHPDWQPMLEAITQALEEHPAHEGQFLRLLSDLKN